MSVAGRRTSSSRITACSHRVSTTSRRTWTRCTATRWSGCGLSPADLDRAPDPRQPERNVATYFRHMITHKNNHHGQIDFIRGLRHPEWELTPGTGIVQRG
jgi:hypothetical protein